jgi:hypothetical protein
VTTAEQRGEALALLASASSNQLLSLSPSHFDRHRGGDAFCSVVNKVILKKKY